MDEVIINTPEEELEVKEPTYKEAEESVTPKKKTRAKKKEKEEVKSFDGSIYKETVDYDEMIPVRQLDKRGRMAMIPTPTGRKLKKEVFTKDFIREYGNGNLHKAKCKYRTGEQFDVDLEQIKKAYSLLSSKKIDGFWVNEIIDRFGWSNGEQKSRQMIADKYDKTVASVEVAQNKLRDILKTSDVAKAYVDLIKDIKEEFSRDLRDKSVYGE